MLRKFLMLAVLLLPLNAYAKQSSEINRYLLGTWKVEAIKANGSTEFRPPRHPIKWTFTANGTLIEQLGKTGAKINWHYTVVGREIKVRVERMAFTWQIIGMDGKIMLVRHQLGLFKVRHM